MRGSQFKIFASLVSGNICFINLASPNKDKIRDFCVFYQLGFIPNQRWWSHKGAKNIAYYMTITHPDMSESHLCIQLKF